jgi:hypothetical protein
MNLPIQDSGALQAISPKPGAAERSPLKGTDFLDRMQTQSPATLGHPGMPPHPGPAEMAGKSVDAVARVDGTRTNPARRVTRGTVPDHQDMFGQFEYIRRDFDAFLQRRMELDRKVAEGKVKADDPKVQLERQAEMRTLLHFQIEMQNAAMKVEIASKVVEHATSGVKTVLSTQA